MWRLKIFCINLRVSALREFSSPSAYLSWSTAKSRKGKITKAWRSWVSLVIMNRHPIYPWTQNVLRVLSAKYNLDFAIFNRLWWMLPTSYHRNTRTSGTCRRISQENNTAKLECSHMASTCLSICFDNIKIHLYLNCRAHTPFINSPWGAQEIKLMKLCWHQYTLPDDDISSKWRQSSIAIY